MTIQEQIMKARSAVNLKVTVSKNGSSMDYYPSNETQKQDFISRAETSGYHLIAK